MQQKKLEKGERTFACVKEIGRPSSICIFPYFVLSFYLNLIQTKKEIMFNKKGFWILILCNKILERKGACAILDGSFLSYRTT